MAEQVILEFVGDPTGLKPLADAMTALGQLTDDQAASLKKATAEFNTRKQAILAAEKASQDSIKASTNALSKEAQQIDKLSAGLTNISKAISGGNLKAVTEEFKKLGSGITGAVVKTTGLKAQLALLKKELQGLDEGGARFKQLSVEAAKLEDKIGDVNQQIRVLASDTFAIDAVVDGVRGITSAFSLAQGAAALLGQEDENLQKALVKINALMLVSTSLQEVSNQLTGQGAAKTAILSAATRVQTFVMGTATEATLVWTRVWNAALVATGIGAFVVGLGVLIAYWDDLKIAIFGATDALEKYNKEAELNDKVTEAIDKDTERAIRALKLKGATEEEILKRKQYGNELAIQLINDEIAANSKLTEADFKNVGDFQKAMERRTALIGMLEDRQLQNQEFQSEFYKKQIADHKAELEEEAQDTEEANALALAARQKHLADLKQAQADNKAALALGFADQLAAIELAMLTADNVDKLALLDAYYDIKRQAALADTEMTANQLKLQTATLNKELETRKAAVLKDLEFKMAVGELDEEDYKKHEADKTAATKKEQMYRQAVIEATQIVVNALFQIAAQQRQAEFAAREKALNDAMEQELSNTELTDMQIANIKDKYRRKEAQLKQEQFKKDRDAALAKAAIDTALAVIKALGSALPPANFIAAALAGIAGAAQIAVIAAQPVPQFAEGTEYVHGAGTGTSDSIHAKLSKGERVVPAAINEKLAGIPNDMLPALAAYANLIPNIGADILNQYERNSTSTIDYGEMAKRLGAEIAKNQQTHINIDRTGINVLLTRGNTRLNYLNNRYKN